MKVPAVAISARAKSMILKDPVGGLPKPTNSNSSAGPIRSRNSPARCLNLVC